MDNTRVMDIIEYYLSEYDVDAVETLGYSSGSKAFEKIGILFGKNNNYLKRLRDEYDVVTSSTRRGQCNRPPRKRILKTAAHLSNLTFEELTEIIKSLIENAQLNYSDEDIFTETSIDEFDEAEIESIINAKDASATIRYRNNATNATRVYNHSIISNLKKLYKGKCQICGDYPIDGVYTDICEAHHIEYFSKSMNNDASNILIVCPNHHTLIHKLNLKFNAKKKMFVSNYDYELKVRLDYHLGRE